jgi:hypothetical protein
VLAARSPEPLRTVAAECERLRVTALAVATDVREEAAVQALAARAHAANYSGRPVRPVPPVVDPEEVARGIVQCARSPKREVTYKRTGRVLELLHSLAPGIYGRFLPPAFEAGNLRRRSGVPVPRERPRAGGRRSGDHRSLEARRPARARAGLPRGREGRRPRRAGRLSG